MSSIIRPAKELLTAHKSVYSLPNVKILERLKWNDELKRWVLSCAININSANKDLVPDQTNWYIFIDVNYPWGRIDFHPSKENGIVKTLINTMEYKHRTT